MQGIPPDVLAAHYGGDEGMYPFLFQSERHEGSHNLTLSLPIVDDDDAPPKVAKVDVRPPPLAPPTMTGPLGVRFPLRPPLGTIPPMYALLVRHPLPFL